MKTWVIWAGMLIMGICAAGAFGFFNQSSVAAPEPGEKALSGAVARAVRPVSEAPDAAAGASGRCGSRGSCGQSAGGGCCSGSSASASSPERLEQLRGYLTEYYSRAVGDGISVEVKDLGCHQEAEIIREGKVIKRLSISGTQVTEIT